MKKKGFTLQEALITVGIIGVIAAITIPAITKMMPNTYQTKYLKIYEAVTNITQEMLVDSSLYWNNSDGQGCDGLMCADVPTQGSVPADLITMIERGGNGDQNAPGWIRKYAAILAYNLHVNDQDLALNAQDVASFITSDGTTWFLERFVNNNDQVIPDTILLTIDLNRTRNDQNATPPDIYRLRIDSDGNVTPADPFGFAFLEDPSSLKKSDIIQLAEQISEDVDNNVMFAQATDMVDMNRRLCDTYPAYCASTNYNAGSIGNGQGSSLMINFP